MTWLLTILLLPLLLILYVLLAPFYLELDSEQGRYRVRFHYLAYAWLNWDDVLPELWVQALWWKKQIDFSKQQRKAEEEIDKPKEQKAKQKRKGMPGWLQLKPALAVAKSFNIDECYVDVDTDDVVLNGQLFPVFYLLGATINHPVSVNFLGQNIIRLQVSNTLGRIAWTYLTNYKISRHGKL